jgi:WD40 repeat protein
LIATVGVAHPTLNDTTIRLIDTNTGQVVQELIRHSGSVRGLAFSPDGRFLISGGQDLKTYVWDIETGERVRTVAEDVAVLESLAMNAEGQIATNYGEEDTEIILFDFETGERLGPFEGHKDWVLALEYNPDGDVLYSGSRNSELYQWDLETGEIIREFVGHDGEIFDVDVNSDGTKLLSASGDQTAIVWDTTTGEPLMTLRGHTDRIIVAEFSPDDSLIMTAAVDGRIILWDAETGDAVHIHVTVHDPLWMAATFSPDGTQIVSSGNDILTFWDISNLPDDYETWVRENRYIPDFTCEQRALYRIEPLCDA